jgi:nucleoside triphosphate pyrophosphatase
VTDTPPAGSPAHRHPLLVLASASPARLATLRAAGLSPAVEVSGVDEDAETATLTDPSVPTLALVLAQAKAQAVAATAHGDVLVLGCDSLLEFDGEPLGKPADTASARTRWRRMRGKSGVLHTGHCLIRCSDKESRSAVASTTVDFADVSDEELEAYLATGEPQRVAGAFTIDGLGGAFVTRIDGDPHNVVGVSLPVLRGLLRDLGVIWTDLWGRG